MASEIDEDVQAAVQVALEDGRLVCIGETAETIAAAAGRPDRVDEIAEALLEASVQQRMAVEIERVRPPQQSDP